MSLNELIRQCSAYTREIYDTLSPNLETVAQQRLATALMTINSSGLPKKSKDRLKDQLFSGADYNPELLYQLRPYERAILSEELRLRKLTCGPSCRVNHTTHGNCQICNKRWGLPFHAGHNCLKKGRWLVESDGGLFNRIGNRMQRGIGVNSSKFYCDRCLPLGGPQCTDCAFTTPSDGVVMVECGPTCTLNHSIHGNCLNCFKPWNPMYHNGHTCRGVLFGNRGRWQYRAIGGGGRLINRAGREMMKSTTTSTYYCGRPGGQCGPNSGLQCSDCSFTKPPRVMASCGPTCNSNHSANGNCRSCRQPWGPPYHHEHSCIGPRGFWIVPAGQNPVPHPLFNSCGPHCRVDHTLHGNCLRCGYSYQNHTGQYGHVCGGGRQAQWNFPVAGGGAGGGGAGGGGGGYGGGVKHGFGGLGGG